MSSWYCVRIGNFKVYENSSHCFVEWYFRKSDRAIIKTVEPDGYKSHLYRTTAKSMQRRLALNGWDRNTLELEFQEELPKLLTEIECAKDYYPNEANLLLDHIEKMDLDDWIAKLKYIETNDLKPYTNDGYSNHEDPVVDYLLCVNKWYSGRNQNFPCITDECLAVAVLSFTHQDTEVIQDCSELVRAGSTDVFDDLIEHQQERTNLFDVYLISISEVENIIHTTQENPTIAKLLFASIITALETYLSDTLKKLITQNNTIKRRYVEHEKIFEKTIKTQDIFRKLERLDKEINNAIDQTSFHNIDTAVKIYQSVLLANFTEHNVSELKKAVSARHDIVHRNGKSFSGEVRIFTFKEVLALVQLANETLAAIDLQIKDSLIVPDNDHFLS